MAAVLLRNRAHKNKPFCALVVADDGDDTCGSSNEILVQWFYQMHDLPRKTRQQLLLPTSSQSRDDATERLVLQRELFLSELRDVSPQSAVVGDAIVLSHADFVARIKRDKILEGNVFFCRGTYDPETRLVQRPSGFKLGSSSTSSSPSSSSSSAGRSQSKRTRRTRPQQPEEDSDDDDEGIDEVTVNIDRFCICGDRAYDVMVCCDLCEDWFHTSCVQLTVEQAQRLKSYVCDNCDRRRSPVRSPATPSPATKRHRVTSPISTSGGGRRGRQQGAAVAKGPSIIEKLPDDCLLIIFSFLSVGQLLAVASSCRIFRMLAHSPSLWQHVDVSYCKSLARGRMVELMEMHRSIKGVRVLLDPAPKPNVEIAVNNYLSSQLTHIEIINPPATLIGSIVSSCPYAQVVTLKDIGCNDNSIDLGHLATLTHLQEIRVASNRKALGLPVFSLSHDLGLFAGLGRQLRILHLECLNNADPALFSFLTALSELESLRLGLCFQWTKTHFSWIGKLSRLHTLGLFGIRRNASPFVVEQLRLLPLLRSLALGDFDMSEDFLQQPSKLTSLTVCVPLYAMPSDIKQPFNKGRIEDIVEMLNLVRYENPHLSILWTSPDAEAIKSASSFATFFPRLNDGHQVRFVHTQ